MINSEEDIRIFELFSLRVKAKPHLKYLDSFKIIAGTPFFLSDFWAICTYTFNKKKQKKILI